MVKTNKNSRAGDIVAAIEVVFWRITECACEGSTDAVDGALIVRDILNSADGSLSSIEESTVALTGDCSSGCRCCNLGLTTAILNGERLNFLLDKKIV